MKGAVQSKKKYSSTWKFEDHNVKIQQVQTDFVIISKPGKPRSHEQARQTTGTGKERDNKVRSRSPSMSIHQRYKDTAETSQKQAEPAKKENLTQKIGNSGNSSNTTMLEMSKGEPKWEHIIPHE